MPPTILTLQMMIDYAVEEKWKQLVFFDCIGNDECTRPYARPLLNCLFKKGIVASIKSLTDATDLSKVLRIEQHRIGVILLIDDIDLNLEDNLLRRIMVRHKNIRSQVLGEYASWLILSTKWNNTQIFDAVKDWPIGIDSDVSVAMSFLSADVILQVLRQFSNNTCKDLARYERNYDYDRLRRSQSIASPESTFVQDTLSASRTVMVFYTASVFKIRVDGNSSLEKEDWNSWSPGRRFTVKERDRPNQRKDLRQYTMNFGLQNSSRFYESDVEAAGSSSSDQVHTSSVETLTELINLFERCLNVSANITNYVFRETAQITKENNDLVRGLTSGEIDIGAAYFEADLDRNKLLSFSYPIVHFKRSIYFRPPETSSNIFLQPFSPKLLLCVLGTLVLIVAVMEVINYVTLFIHWNEDQEHFGLGEATLWCLSIMCIQGSPWTPRTRAGKTVLLVSLIFSLITYNSYSGFITSILSVKTTMINNVSDFFHYDYAFGCSKSDENYIILKEELRNFYVKALEGNQMKVPEKTGLEKTINGSYAFFIAETVAKRIFRNALMFKRCQISELQTNTPGTLALPISNNSPYKKIINISILRMWQYGMLRKLTLKIKPPLLDCMGVLKYKQARLADVYGAFCILAAGALAALALFFCERAWASRQRLRGIQRRFGISRAQPLNKQPVQDKHEHRSRGNVLLAATLPIKIVGLDREIKTAQAEPRTFVETPGKFHWNTAFNGGT
ncbi:hypothetical protein TKK_0015895 [Trichogramma kaykai]